MKIFLCPRCQASFKPSHTASNSVCKTEPEQTYLLYPSSQFPWSSLSNPTSCCPRMQLKQDLTKLLWQLGNYARHEAQALDQLHKFGKYLETWTWNKNERQRLRHWVLEDLEPLNELLTYIREVNVKAPEARL
ncbi:hypothetical protein GOBAR_DD06383 [Gossypium barbadense]|nr:hypothetical protein GOBAR_DD06383 [Gossypium barbadense]